MAFRTPPNRLPSCSSASTFPCSSARASAGPSIPHCAPAMSWSRARCARPTVRSSDANRSARARLHALLIETSRTFALCIPLLDDVTRLQVTIAYLLFRVADTFEDASHWPVADRLSALEGLCTLLRNPDPEEAQRLATKWHAQV